MEGEDSDVSRKVEARSDKRERGKKKKGVPPVKGVRGIMAI